jgi:hypothetical protein
MEREDWKRMLLTLKHQVEIRDEYIFTQNEIVEGLHWLLDEAGKHLETKLQEIRVSTDNSGESGRIELIKKIDELIDYIDNVNCDLT